jgi:DNA-binding YbaB/EbfC family protein
MLKGLGNIASILNQAKTMGPKMEAMQEKLKTMRVSGASGGGMVTVHASGTGEILSVEFDDVLKESQDLEMAKDLLPAAINAAVEKVNELRAQEMKSVTEDLPLPENMEDMMKKFLGGGN